ncbi:hypothetical protein ACHAWF_004446 [Thalassiosira exigua]
MKLPWSKNNEYPYTKHSAPITNGILRNSKLALDDKSKFPRDNEGLRVAFSLPETANPQRLRASENKKYSRPIDVYPKSLRKNRDKNRGSKGKGSPVDRPAHVPKHSPKTSSSGTPASTHVRQRRNSMSGHDPKRRLGDVSADKIASGYGKWPSNETIDTADLSDVSEERGHSQKRLSALIDEKIKAKARKQAERQVGAS